MTTTPEVGTTVFSTPSDTVLVGTRVFDAPRALVWEAMTNPEHLPKWMTGPDVNNMTRCDADMRPGGAWHFAWRLGDGSTMEMTGEYREVDPPAKVVMTENWGGDWPETLQTIELIEQEDGTTLSVATVVYPSKDAREAAMATGMTNGWSVSYDRLDGVLAAM